VTTPPPRQLDAATRAGVERVVAAFRRRILEVIQGEGSGEVHAVAVISDRQVTDRSHLDGPREYPLRRRA